jgi:hypothetical protein
VNKSGFWAFKYRNSPVVTTPSSARIGPPGTGRPGAKVFSFVMLFEQVQRLRIELASDYTRWKVLEIFHDAYGACWWLSLIRFVTVLSVWAFCYS